MRTNPPPIFLLFRFLLQTVFALQQALEGSDLVFHLASGSLPQSSNRDPHADVQVNLLGTLNLLEAARPYGREAIGHGGVVRWNGSRHSSSCADS